jgi:hypothetical protein
MVFLGWAIAPVAAVKKTASAKAHVYANRLQISLVIRLPLFVLFVSSVGFQWDDGEAEMNGPSRGVVQVACVFVSRDLIEWAER